MNTPALKWKIARNSANVKNGDYMRILFNVVCLNGENYLETFWQRKAERPIKDLLPRHAALTALEAATATGGKVTEIVRKALSDDGMREAAEAVTEAEAVSRKARAALTEAIKAAEAAMRTIATETQAAEAAETKAEAEAEAKAVKAARLKAEAEAAGERLKAAEAFARKAEAEAKAKPTEAALNEAAKAAKAAEAEAKRIKQVFTAVATQAEAEAAEALKAVAADSSRAEAAEAAKKAADYVFAFRMFIKNKDYIGAAEAADRLLEPRYGTEITKAADEAAEASEALTEARKAEIEAADTWTKNTYTR